MKPVLFILLAWLSTAAAATTEHDCLMQPDELVRLGSPVGGVISEVLVDRGDRVEAGQAVARIEASAERAAVELAAARAEFGRRKVARNQDLYTDELLSVHERDEIETEALIAELEHAQARAILALRSLASPITGVVVERAVAPGELVRDGVILTLAKVDPLRVEVVLPVDAWGSVRAGDMVEVLPVEPVGGSYSARVSVVDPVVDAASGTFGVVIELPNPDYRLPAGLRCTARFSPKTAPGSTAR